MTLHETYELTQLKDGWCGPASLALAYQFQGEQITQQQIASETLCDTEGLAWFEMIANAILHGFNPKFRENGRTDQLKEGDIVCFQKGVDDSDFGSHFSVVVYNDQLVRLLTILDVEDGAYTTYSHGEFDSIWYDDEGRRSSLTFC